MPVIQKVSGEEALARVQDAAGAKLARAEVLHGQLDLTVAPADLVEVITILRDTEGLACRFFTFLSAVDRSEFADKPETMPDLEVLVHVYSPEHALHVTVHVPLDPAAPACPSLTGLYLGAIWHERETFEMFGIDFDGHPRLVGIYLPEDFEGHPLRRSFKLPARGAVKEWPGAKDPEEAAAGGR